MRKFERLILISVYEEDTEAFDILIETIYDVTLLVYSGIKRDKKLMDLKYNLIFVKTNTRDFGKKSLALEGLITKINSYISSNRNAQE